MAEFMFGNFTSGWVVPRVAKDGVVSAEEEARCKELERALNAGEVRPSYWTEEMEADLGKKLKGSMR
jgi:hypothetical protein